jgi:hypothetical protein
MLAMAGCAAAPLQNQPSDIMQDFKHYQRTRVYAAMTPWTSTKVVVEEGDKIVLFASGRVMTNSRSGKRYGPYFKLYYTIGDDFVPMSALYGKNERIFEALTSGRLKLTVRDWRNDGTYEDSWYSDNLGSYLVDIFVIDKEKELSVPDLMQKLARANPQDRQFVSHIERFLEDYEYYFTLRKALVKTDQEIKETKMEMAGVNSILEEAVIKKEETVAQKAEEQQPPAVGEPPAEAATPHPEVHEGLPEDDIRRKYAELLERLKELEALKMRYEAEEVQREQEFLSKLEMARKRAPVVLVGMPRDGLTTQLNKISFSGVVEDDQPTVDIELSANGQVLKTLPRHEMKPSNGNTSNRAEFRETVVLTPGENRLQVKVTDADGLETTKEIVVHHVESRQNLWAVVVGINNYANILDLSFAADDARAYYSHLVDNMKIPKENIRLLINEEAGLTKIRSALGTYLKRKAGKEDMVLIFFAGHGATEKDALSPDGDGLEKYILPQGADPGDLYATALPMAEISKIFQRIQSERLIFIADACYSGASGGRTIGISGVRMTLSDAFWDRIVTGKGRVILTASGPNEVSVEDDELGHGVFTYYLLEGLRGKADMDGDAMISVDELYSFVSKKVATATGQSQHPVKKGSVEGQLIIGVLE